MEKEYKNTFFGKNPAKMKIGFINMSGKPPEYPEIRNWINKTINENL